MSSGIYRIRVCKNPLSFYIGQAKNFADRKNAHFASLGRNTHWNNKFQEDYNKYGESAFYFEILLICDPVKETLRYYEQAVLDSYAARFAVYNIRTRCVVSSLGIPASPERRQKVASALRGLKRSDETKAKVAAAQAWKKTPEGRAHLSAQSSGNIPSLETRAKMSASRRGRTVSEETKAKIRATRARIVAERGTIYTPEGLAAIREAQSRRTNYEISEEARQQLSAARKRNWADSETRSKILTSREGKYPGFSKEARARSREVRLGRALSVEHRRKLSKVRTGRQHSPETREKISRALKGRVQK